MNGKVAVVDSSKGVSSVIPNAVSSSVLNLIPNLVPSSNVIVSASQVAEKSEVLKLKKRIDEMTKNIDKLTQMVQKVSLFQQTGEDIVDQSVAQTGSKRKKTPQQTDFAPNYSRNTDVAFPDLPMPDEAFSTSMMDIDELISPDNVSSSTDFLQVPPPAPLSRESSSTDADYVDQLFTAFNDDDDVIDWFASHNKNASSFKTCVKDADEFLVMSDQTNNRPNSELMQRLSDALQLLPRDIQELIVNRLIEAITSSEGFVVPPPIEGAAVATTSTVTPTRILTPQLLASPKLVDTEQPKKATYIASSKSLPEQQQQIQPLAAATLAALLHHYSNQIKIGSQQQQNDTVTSESKKNIKTLPVIQVHA